MAWGDPVNGRPERIAVIGGGCSGVLVAAHLLRRPSTVPRTVILIDRRASLGGGTAFGTRRPCHLLNVPAGRMSAFSEDPGHFVAWAQQQDPTIDATTFVSRASYRAYLRDVLRDAQRDAPLGNELCAVTSEARAIEGLGHAQPGVRLRSGALIAADAIVLALGNLRPKNPPVDQPGFYESHRYTTDPWAPGAMERIPVDEPLVLVGTGLTAVDVVLALEARGSRREIHAISRHGMLPQAHRPDGPSGIDRVRVAPILAAATTRELVHAVRAEVRSAERRGDDWRAVVNALRPHTSSIWQSLPMDERRRFVNHAARHWETHRHRMAPQVAATIDQLRDRGRLKVSAGRVTSYTETTRGVDVQVRRRGGERSVISAGHVVNCIGAGYDVVGAGEPVIDSLVAVGAARPGPLGLGLDVDRRGAVLDGNGRASSRLWTIGGLRRGALWESTAVPEIREQAAALADDVPAGAIRGRIVRPESIPA